MPEYPFRDRTPTAEEFEELVLALSTFRDGSGQQIIAGASQPGWRDFERATASALRGDCPENKGVFDVVIPVDDGLPYGLSLKTSRANAYSVLMELHNSHAKAWKWLEEGGIDPEVSPEEAGPSLVDQVHVWHQELADEIDVDRSSYLVLTHDAPWRVFRLYWFSLNVFEPDPRDMVWAHEGRRIFGVFGDHRYWDWYGWSGGQLKYYPPQESAFWISPEFELEDPPHHETPLDRARRYWPDRFDD